MAAQSAAIGLTLWFKERVNRNGGRLKMTTIVALARKLLVALWKYVTAGVVNGDMVHRSVRRHRHGQRRRAL
jgi:hypothetical protein